MTTTVHNAAHAAAVWLQRLGAPPDAAVVITLLPSARLGWWAPGRTAVAVVRDLGDPEAELLEAAGPLAQELLARLGADAQAAAVDAAALGRCRLQLVVDAEAALLRVVDAERAVVLAAVALDGAEPMH